MIRRILGTVTTFLLRVLNWFKRDRRKAPAMTIADLQPGDILLFSGESMISELIKLLSGGGESHAAMAFTEPDTLVHEIPQHAQTGQMSELFKTRKVSVMRPSGNLKESTRNGIMLAAAAFVDAEEPYPMSTIYLLGLMIIYRRVRPNAKQQKYEAMIVRRVIAEIEAYLSKRNYPGKLPMVCSQFVHECYKRGGVNLKIKNGVLLGADKNQGGIDLESTKPNLLESVMQQTNLMATAPSASEAMWTELDELSDEELAQRYMAAVDSDGDSDEPIPELAAEVTRLGEVVQSALQAPSNDDQLLSVEDQQQNAIRGLQWLKENESLFVTPADLLFHCDALEKVGIIRC